MRKILIAIMVMLVSYTSEAQFIQGSVRKGTAYNQVDVMFRSTFNSNVGEYVNYVQFSLSIPVSAYQAGVTATLTPVGPFAPLVFAQGPQYTQGSTNERVFTWVCVNPAVTAMSWTTADFVGATVTFTGGIANTLVKMCDYTNAGGGSNSNTYFAINVTQHGGDVTNYGDLYFTNLGESTENIYGNGDQFVQTSALVSLPVDFLNFSGYRAGARNILNWTTSSEQNNKGFEVQRSIDGSNYVALGFVNSLAPGGNSATELSYTFSDNNLSGSRQYYRLKQVNLDNSSKYSNIVLIKGDRGMQMTIDGLYP
ncbi:MAG: hypothetical protein HOP10_15205, partial [Chitinophagaceae bacterium]|nr:hypothetical protein [Chitinophagaceae bacterium]